jgi:hypothetical protein
MFDNSSKIIGNSLRFTHEYKERLHSLINQAQSKYEGLELIADKTVNPAYKVEEEIFLADLQIQQIAQFKSILVDFVISQQDNTHYESAFDRQKSENKRQSTLGSTKTDELGNLVELVTVEPDLIQCLLKMGHIIRVWLQLPQ